MTTRGFQRPVAVLNPRAGGGKARRLWPRLQRLLERRIGPVEGLFTERPNHATELTRKALTGGADLAIAVGGDGTVNEVVNGFFLGGMSIQPDAAFALIPLGTGGDFQRTARMPPDPEQAALAIASGERRPIDLARASLVGHGGEPVDRYFANLASFGMGGEVATLAKHSFFAKLSGQTAFLWASFAVFLRYKGKRVRLTLDGEPLDGELLVTNVAVGNGEFHGAGMHPCPRARLDSGALEVTVIDRLTMVELIRDIKTLYSDDIYQHPKVRHYRAKRIAAESDEIVSIEVDGEALGRLPLEISVVPGAIDLVGAGPRALTADQLTDRS